MKPPRTARSRPVGVPSAPGFALFLFFFATGPGPAAAEIRFNRDIRPILSDKCFQCHGPDAAARKADLRLDQREAALEILAPGKPDQSELLARVRHADPKERMPPRKTHKTISGGEMEMLRQWIASGAEYEPHWSFIPVTRPAPPAVKNEAWIRNPIDRFVLARLESEEAGPSPEADPRTLIRRITLDLTGLPPTPEEVEEFIRECESARARPAESAKRRAGETATVQNSAGSPARPLPIAEGSGNSAIRIPSSAIELLADRLLASPRYGEHFAYQWLDATRYADSDGYESDPLRNMWPWRDWVVEALNANMPYDKFITAQLAGDLLPAATLRQKLATGFNRNHRLNNEGGILPEEWVVEYVCDRAETTAMLFLGLTWNCARCHDHKYDPILQRDYYSLFAFFNNIEEKGSSSGAKTAVPMMDVPRLEHFAEYQQVLSDIAPAQKQLDALEKSADFIKAHAAWLVEIGADAEARAKLPGSPGTTEFTKWTATDKSQAREHFLQFVFAPPELQKEFRPLNKRLAELRRTGSRVMIMDELPDPKPAFILERGAYDQPREEVAAGTPGFLPPMDAALPKNRLGLAQWLVAPDNPLTARVAVNRVWERFFGIGLVKTQEDFGLQGEPPSHPELLDWLATHFMESGWDLKALQKTIVTSNTYRQSSAAPRGLLAQDPDNRLLARGPRYRLPAAVIRDQALAASGLLVEQRGGPPVKPYQPDGLWREVIKGRVPYVPDTGDKLYRRSLYTLWRRAVNPPLMALLDANLRDTCSVSQNRTNTPLQALLLMNDVTFVEASRGLGTRLLREGGDSDAARATLGMRLATGRPPTDGELEILTAELDSQRTHYRARPEDAQSFITVGDSKPNPSLDPVELAAHTALARVLLNLDETITKQ